ncbi:hypothetical protein [Dyadobacter sandarakinus]|uniref:PKD domain-containing protein n=1 Tax=Dyadobacter sandarakinus TaxID=2747268 RepID=A0ABX7I120_9BACT|nr:hypothetical protein [Dyadobacter sandarakinus]QRQ99542.1 hypothetical protein HWI92_00740 [Dyadobacter sandarakinus]
MKKSIFTIFALLALLAFNTTSRAGTYYVVSGEPFSLAPASGSTSFFQYLWTLDPGTGQVIRTLDQASGGVLTHTFGDGTATSASLHKITLGVLTALDGCLSEVVEHTIIVLPKLTVSITADKENFCSNAAVNSKLTATVSAATGLDTYGVTLSPFAWKLGSNAVDGQTSSVLNVTAPGTYSALVTYVLPTTGSFIPTASKIAGAIVGGTKQILNNLPLPTAPAITLN